MPRRKSEELKKKVCVFPRNVVNTISGILYSVTTPSVALSGK